MKKRAIKFEENLDTPVTLVQTSKNKFTVIYGLQKKECSSYAEAAKELGECIMHSLACANRIDNG